MNLTRQAAAVSTRALVDSLVLEETGAGRYRAQNMPTRHTEVFGGQFLAQAVAAALAGRQGMTAKTLHTLFASAGDPEVPLDIEVEPISGSETIASSVVTIRQAGQVRTRSLALLSADEPDFVRHADRRDVPPLPTREAGPNLAGPGRYQLYVTGGVSLDPSAVGPAELDVWARFDGAPDDWVTSQALLAYATQGLLIPTAMRPHKGVGLALSDTAVSTGMLSHTITFHEQFSAAGWLLMAQRSPYAGHGHSYGHAAVFREDGQLVASFAGDSVVRSM